MGFKWFRNGLPYKDTHDIEGKQVYYRKINNEFSEIRLFDNYGRLRRSHTKKNNKLHIMNGKPSTIVYTVTNEIEEELYHYNGLRHRDGDKPAMIVYLNGVVNKEYFYIKGHLIKIITYGGGGITTKIF